VNPGLRPAKSTRDEQLLLAGVSVRLAIRRRRPSSREFRKGGEKYVKAVLRIRRAMNPVGGKRWLVCRIHDPCIFVYRIYDPCNFGPFN
jgi:hypothetical protein